MDISFFSYAVLVEIIILLIAWIGFIHWRLSKKKKQLMVADAAEAPDPFEVYLQYLNRELSDTKAHLDDLAENQSEDIEAINMYQYRLKHLEAEHAAMVESKGEVIKFWELYRSNINFVYTDEEPDEAEENIEAEPEAVPEEPIVETGGIKEFKENSSSIIEQSNNVIELIQKIAAKDDSEELSHMLGLLTSERDQLSGQLKQMEEEYNRLMHNAALQSTLSNEASVIHAELDDDESGMSKVLSKQNTRISELSDIVGDLSLELEDKKRLVKETEWVTRQLKENEHVVVILEDENAFLRSQIKQLLEQ